MSTEREAEIFIGVLLNNDEVEEYIYKNKERSPLAHKELKEHPKYKSIIAETLAEELSLDHNQVYGWDGELHIIGYRYEESQNLEFFINELEGKAKTIKQIFNKEVEIIPNINSY